MRYFSLLMGVLVFSCQPPMDHKKEREAIMEASRAFSQAYVDRDLEKQMSYYTHDAVIIPGTRPMIQGIEGVTRYWDIPASVQVLDHKATSTRLEIAGNIASDYGIYEGVSVRNNDTIPFRGQYVITWRKEEGRWRMAVDMWSPLRE